MSVIRNHRYMTQQLDRLLVVWTKTPHLRLGQLIANAVPEERLFSIEDDALGEAVVAFEEEYKANVIP